MITKPFTLYFRVRYAECDAQKIVFNGRYADYADLAATEFIRVVWGNYQNVLESGIDNQVVNLNIDWFAPAMFDDVVAIEVKTGNIGNTSYSLEMKMYRHTIDTKPNTVLASMSLTYVVVDATTYIKMPIPVGLRESLIQGAVGVSVNQSGAELR
ncbi:MAG: acyl-CoA thioesterase [Gammaproteobacteria bacterium]|nr:acyl-CoA thioesterase [Gammaproteobacteria bacterium]